MSPVMQPNSRRKAGRGARLVIVVLALVIVAAGALLLLPAMGLKLPAFLPRLVLVTATPADADSRGATGSPLAANTAKPTQTQRPSSTRVATATASLSRAEVISDALNVRTGPGTEYPKIDVLVKGDQVVVTGRTETGDWLAVTLADGKNGWVAASMVTLNVPVGDIALAGNIPEPPTAEPTSEPAMPTATSEPAVPTATLTIDEQIATIAGGAHGELPQPGSMGGVSAGGAVEVTIVNDTPYVLTVLVGSPSSTSITLEACSSCALYNIVGPSSCQEEGRPTTTVRLQPGNTQVVARVNDPGVVPFLGNWDLQPDTGYFTCFFIVVG